MPASASASVVLCRYLYDPLDRLAGSVPMAQAQVRHFYRQNRLATQIQGAVQCTIFQSDDCPLAEQRRLDARLTTTLLATDRQRSVLQCVEPTSTQALVYDTYGYQAPQSGLGSLLGFNGERCDPLTGHYLLGNGYRAFNPVLMRFNSPDSLSPFGAGGLNAYAYCQGDPINLNDPDGHMLRAGRSPVRRASMQSSPDLMDAPRAPSPLPTMESLLSSTGMQISFDAGDMLSQFDRHQGVASQVAVAGPSSAMSGSRVQAGTSSSVGADAQSRASVAPSVEARLSAREREVRYGIFDMRTNKGLRARTGAGRERGDRVRTKSFEKAIEAGNQLLRHFQAGTTARDAQAAVRIDERLREARGLYDTFRANYHQQFGRYPRGGPSP